MADRYLRWYAIKIFGRDKKILEELNLSSDLKAHLEEHIADREKELDDDAESIIANQRYFYINGMVSKAVKKKAAKHSLSVSDQIDQVVTNRVLALPIFAAVMFLVYALARRLGNLVWHRRHRLGQRRLVWRRLVPPLFQP